MSVGMTEKEQHRLNVWNQLAFFSERSNGHSFVIPAEAGIQLQPIRFRETWRW
jgi:hypothetical protein